MHEFALPGLAKARQAELLAVAGMGTPRPPRQRNGFGLMQRLFVAGVRRQVAVSLRHLAVLLRRLAVLLRHLAVLLRYLADLVEARPARPAMTGRFGPGARA